MVRRNFVPFGSLEGTSKRTFLTMNYNLVSQLIIPWEIFHGYFKQDLEKFPQVVELFKNAISSNKEQSVSKSEFEVVNNAINALADTWDGFIIEARGELWKRIRDWHTGSRRGYFRFVLLLTLTVLYYEAKTTDMPVYAKGLGGEINSRIKKESNGILEAKAGSLYVAIQKFEDIGLLEHYTDVNGKIEKKIPLVLTEKGHAYLFGMIQELHKFLEDLRNKNIATVADVGILNSAITLLNEWNKQGNPYFPLDGIPDEIDKFPELVEHVQEKWKVYMNPFEIEINELIERWKSNFTRGIVDIYILGQLMKRPGYGKGLFRNSNFFDNFQSGTVYPKISDFMDESFLNEIIGKKRKDLVRENKYPAQGPQKMFYICSISGAFYFMLLWVLFLSDLKILFKLIKALNDLVPKESSD